MMSWHYFSNLLSHICSLFGYMNKIGVKALNRTYNKLKIPFARAREIIHDHELSINAD